eukprot:3149712-Prymnesium_polylepis.1
MMADGVAAEEARELSETWALTAAGVARGVARTMTSDSTRASAPPPPLQRSPAGPASPSAGGPRKKPNNRNTLDAAGRAAAKLAKEEKKLAIHMAKSEKRGGQRALAGVQRGDPSLAAAAGAEQMDAVNACAARKVAATTARKGLPSGNTPADVKRVVGVRM